MASSGVKASHILGERPFVPVEVTQLDNMRSAVTLRATGGVGRGPERKGTED